MHRVSKIYFNFSNGMPSSKVPNDEPDNTWENFVSIYYLYTLYVHADI